VPPTPLTCRSERSSSIQQRLEFSVLSSLPRHHNSPLAKFGCQKHAMDFHGDHTSQCTAHSGATKAHDWMVSALGPLFRTAGHTVRTQHGVTDSAANGAVTWRSAITYGTRLAAGAWSSTSASPMTVMGVAAIPCTMGA
jgi:hypothetical protein